MKLVMPRMRHHRVESGDSLFKVSRKYGVDAYEMARLNNLHPPYRIYVGQDLALPSSGRVNPGRITAVERKPASKLIQTSITPAEPSEIETSSLPAPIKNRTEPAPPPSIRMTAGRFAWPVRGKILSGFGSKGEGLHNDGINILARAGAPVQAAENGVVAYAGNELRGFGNLLLVKHSGGWVTAYAHNQALLVRRGDTVSRGQVIAKVGATGNVVSPQLHFEIRKNQRAVNPIPYMGQRRAGRSGNLLAETAR